MILDEIFNVVAIELFTACPPQLLEDVLVSC